MKRYELRIEIMDSHYIDALITALVRQGYNVYYNPDNGNKGTVYTTIMDDVLDEVKLKEVTE